MKKFGIIANGKPIPNTTVTTFPSTHDYKQANKVCKQKGIGGKKTEKVLDSIVFKNMRNRFAGQGALDTRYFPIGV